MTPVLEVKGLKFRYPDGTPALRGVNLQVSAKERVAVIGPNGAGKSTLFFHLNGIFRGEGEIRVFGKPLTDQTLFEVRRRVGLVFQDPNDQLFMPTVFEDVAFGPVNLGLSELDIRARVRKALEQVGMQGSEALVPHHLSLGERRKIALAAVLALEPEILAFDEPSGGLDPRSRRALMDLLQGLPQTILIATHDLDLVLDVCQRAVIIDRGEIVEEGGIPAIFEDEKRLHAHGLERPLRMQGLQFQPPKA
jgi:cobalt/nickel transport system ATP-binding protein